MTRNFWRRFLAHRLGTISLLIIVALALAAASANLLFSGDPKQISDDVMLAPSLLHPLGTDDLGRDVLTNIVYGIRVSLTVGLLAALGASFLGSLLGALAGYYGGALDLIVMRISEIFQVIPTFILAAVIVALSGPGLPQIIIVIVILSWPQTARLMRSEVLRIRKLEYVDAVRCLGVSERRILLGEVVPNAIGPALAVCTLIVGQAILLEASLAFFGLSSPDIVSWGQMLNSGQRFLFNAWWLSFFPGLAIFVTVLAFNLIGDAIGFALNPRAE
jgi:peptide/nickel transport system permease protein